MYTRPTTRCTPHRLGGSLTGLLAVVGISAGVIGGVVAFRPMLAQASGDDGPTPIAAPLHEDQAALHESLEGLLARSRAILAVHERGETPYAEMLIWMTDTENPGTVDPNELAVVSHSRILRTVTMFRLDETSLNESDRQWGSLLGGMPDAATLVSSRFCDTWRGHPAVRPEVLGTGVTDMRVTVDTTSQADRQLLHVGFQWHAPHPDRPNTTALLVDASLAFLASESAP